MKPELIESDIGSILWASSISGMTPATIQKLAEAGQIPAALNLTLGYLEAEFPPGYLEAWNKSPDRFAEDGLLNIWEQIEGWRDYETGSERLKTRLNAAMMAIRSGLEWSPDRLQEMRESQGEDAEEFKARILKAILEDDKVFIANFYKAFNTRERPSLWAGLTSVFAAQDAFYTLFAARAISQGNFSSDSWPTKQEVRLRAEKELIERGEPIPTTPRQWSRIYDDAGLSGLLSVTVGRAHKRKATSRTK